MLLRGFLEYKYSESTVATNEFTALSIETTTRHLLCHRPHRVGHDGLCLSLRLCLSVPCLTLSWVWKLKIGRKEAYDMGDS